MLSIDELAGDVHPHASAPGVLARGLGAGPRCLSGHRMGGRGRGAPGPGDVHGRRSPVLDCTVRRSGACCRPNCAEHTPPRDPFIAPFRPGRLARALRAIVDQFVERLSRRDRAGRVGADLRWALAGPLAAIDRWPTSRPRRGRRRHRRALGGDRAIVESSSASLPVVPRRYGRYDAMSDLDGCPNLVTCRAPARRRRFADSMTAARTAEVRLERGRDHVRRDRDHRGDAAQPGVASSCRDRTLRCRAREPHSSRRGRGVVAARAGGGARRSLRVRDGDVAGTAIAGGRHWSRCRSRRQPRSGPVPQADRFDPAPRRRRLHSRSPRARTCASAWTSPALEVVTAATALVRSASRLRLAADAPGPDRSGLPGGPERLPMRCGLTPGSDAPRPTVSTARLAEPIEAGSSAAPRRRRSPVARRSTTRPVNIAFNTTPPARPGRAARLRSPAGVRCRGATDRSARPGRHPAIRSPSPPARRLDAERMMRQARRRGVHPAPPAAQQVGDAESRIASEPALENLDLRLVRPAGARRPRSPPSDRSGATSALTLTPIALAIGRNETSASRARRGTPPTASSSSTRRSTSGRRPTTAPRRCVHVRIRSPFGSSMAR